MTEPRLPIKSAPERMHRLYVELTGLQIPFSMQRLYAWELFCLKFTEQDLRDLVKINRSKGLRGRSLQFRSLIAGASSVEFAEEDLAEYRANKRAHPPITARQEILRAAHRPMLTETPVKTAAQVLADADALASFRQWKEQNL